MTGEEAVGFSDSSRKSPVQDMNALSLPPVDGKPNPIDKAIAMLTNAEIVSKVEDGSLPQYKLESELNDLTRAVEIRRQVLGMELLLCMLILHTYNNRAKHGTRCVVA